MSRTLRGHVRLSGSLYVASLGALWLLSAIVSAWAVVGPVSEEGLDGAAHLYRRVEELWRAKVRGDLDALESMVVPGARRQVPSQSIPSAGLGSSGPLIEDFLVEAITLNQAGNLARVEISSTLKVPGAPVTVPQEQSEFWEKVGSEWYYNLPMMMEMYDRPATDVVRQDKTDPFSPSVSERFDRFRIATFWASKASQLLDGGNEAEARSLLADAVRIGSPFIWEKLVKVEGLLAKSRIWEDLVPKTKEDLLELVSVLENLNRQDEATRLLRQFLESAPSDFEVLERLGDVLSDRGDGEGAIKAYRKATTGAAWSDDFQRVEWKLGKQCFAAGRDEAAVVALATAAAADPMSEELQSIISNLAQALESVGEHARAHRFYSIAGSFSSAGTSSLLGRIRTAQKLKDVEDLLHCAWLSDGSDASINEGLSRSWSDLRRAIKREGKDASSYYKLGLLAESLGNEEAARKAFDESRDLSRDHVGSILHLCPETFREADPGELRRDLSVVRDKLKLEARPDVSQLAEALSRAPSRARPPLQDPSMDMPILFSEGNLSRIVLISGKDKSSTFTGAPGVGCVDGAILALDVSESGVYFLSFDLEPFGLQGEFASTLVLLLDGRPIEILPLRLHRLRYGKSLQLDADTHSLQLVLDPVTLKPDTAATAEPWRRFLLANVQVIPHVVTSDRPVGEDGQFAPVEIASISSGNYRGAYGDIYVDCTQVSCLLPGYNLVASDGRTGKVLSSVNFNASAGDKVEPWFKTWVDMLNPSSAVAVAVLGDGTYRAQETTKLCIEALGGKDALVQEGTSWSDGIAEMAGVQLDQRKKETRGGLFPRRFRQSYALLGAKNAESGSVLESSSWEMTAVARPREGAKVSAFVETLSPCRQMLWSESASRLTDFFLPGNYSFIRRLPFDNPLFTQHVLPSIKSSDPTYYLMLGKRLEECLKFDDALRAYDEGLAAEETADLHFAKSHLKGKMRDYDGAKAAYEAGAAVSPRPKLRGLKDLVKDDNADAIETIFVSASNGETFQFVNGIATAVAHDGWALTAINPSSGQIVTTNTLNKHDTLAIAEALDGIPQGAIIIISGAGENPLGIDLLFQNAIEASVRRETLPRLAFKNLVLVGYKLRKPRGFFEASYDEASLMVTSD